MSDDVELERLLKDLYRTRQEPEVPSLGVPSSQIQDSQHLRSGVSEDQLCRLQNAISQANAATKWASIQHRPSRGGRMFGVAITAAAIGGVWLSVADGWNTRVPGGWVFEAQQELRPFRGADEAVTSGLPTYGPNSQVLLVFRRPNAGDDIGVGNIFVYRLVDERMLLVSARVTLRTSTDAHVVVIEGRGRVLFGEQPGTIDLGFLFIPNEAIAAMDPADVDVLRALDETRWLEQRFLYKMSGVMAPN